MLLALTSARPFFNGDRYIVDGGSGKVRSIVDHNDATHILDQATTARQVPLPAAHADYGGRLCYTNTAVNGGFYASNRAVSAWNYTCDGSGVEIYDARTHTANTANQVGWTTVSGAVPGIIQIHTSPNLTSEVRGAAGASRLTLASAALSIGTPVVYRFSHGSSDTPDGRTQSTGGSEITGDYTGALVASPTVTLGVLALNTAGTLPFIGRMRWLGFFPLLTPAQRTWIMSVGLSV